MVQKIIITITTPMLPEAQERLEDKIKGLLEVEKLDATIDNLGTGNSTVVEGIYIKELKKPDDIIKVHQCLESIFGE